jgi:hypothetical protein
VRDLTGPKGQEKSQIKRPTDRKHHRPEEIVAKLRQANDALGTSELDWLKK